MTASHSSLDGLARDFTRLPGWAWREGMAVRAGKLRGRIVSAYPAARDLVYVAWDLASLPDRRVGDRLRALRPDLDDDATLGAILGLARGATGDSTLCVHGHYGELGDCAEWSAWSSKYGIVSDGSQDFFDSEAHALYAALRSAPVGAP